MQNHPVCAHVAAFAGSTWQVREPVILTDAHPTSNLSSKLKSLGAKYGLNLLSASRIRKIGATSVALNLGDSAKAHLVTWQMSQSVSIDAEYYQEIVGDSHAASAFETMTQHCQAPPAAHVFLKVTFQMMEVAAASCIGDCDHSSILPEPH